MLTAFQGMPMQLLQGLFGKQVAAPAPAFNQPSAPVGGLLGPTAGQPPSAVGGNGLLDALGAANKQTALTGPELDPVAQNLKDQSLADIDNGQETPNFFQNFMGGIDKGLQSPSQVLGLGLLSQLGGNNNALPIAGLLGMGLLNRNR